MATEPDRAFEDHSGFPCDQLQRCGEKLIAIHAASIAGLMGNGGELSLLHNAEATTRIAWETVKTRLNKLTHAVESLPDDSSPLDEDSASDGVYVSLPYDSLRRCAERLSAIVAAYDAGLGRNDRAESFTYSALSVVCDTYNALLPKATALGIPGRLKQEFPVVPAPNYP